MLSQASEEGPTTNLRIDTVPVATALRDGAILQNVFNHIELLPDIICLSATNRALQAAGIKTMRHRWESILRPFIGGHMFEFSHIMQLCKIVITGSCTMAMLVGEGNREALYSFLLDDLRYHRVQRNILPHRAFKGTIRSFAKFRREDRVITVSEATVDGPFDVIVSSQTTADMLCMTAGGLVTFYPHLTLNLLITMANHTAPHRHARLNVGSAKTDRFAFHRTSSFIHGPCGVLCPALWRSVSDQGRQSLTLEWDQNFSIKPLIDSSRTVWRLALRCRNSECLSNRRRDSRQKALPPRPVPCTPTTIKQQELRIANHAPRYDRAFTGILYATGVTKPSLVTIPVREFALPVKQLSDLEILHWLDALGPERYMSTSSRFRKTYNPKYGVYHAHSYTFFREHPMAYTPPNLCIRTAADVTPGDEDVTGNVLVIKHVHGRKHDLVHCGEDDVSYVNTILKMTVTQSDFWL
ncbi:hypothetical protein BD769DRAFT_1670199 [Suillus cothurnatus]|nr:hypothetical protein BD769DRAFT_1670199 [Suillus cothurnatus]